MKRARSTTLFSDAMKSSLGISSSPDKKKRKKVTRKERRREDRIKKKKKPSQSKSLSPRENPSADSHSSLSKIILKDAKAKVKPSQRTTLKSAPKFLKPTLQEDPEDVEIARLEKLLGVSGKGQSRQKSASKLNREFEMYEGIGGNFGDFLFKLDDFTEYAKSQKNLGESFLGDDSDSDKVEEISDYLPKLLNDSDQEVSDVDADELQDDELNESDDENVDSSEQESDEDGINEEKGEGWFDDADEYAHNTGLDNSEIESDTESVLSAQVQAEDTYRPVSGEDIYGRVLGDSNTTAASKYVPPALRKRLGETKPDSASEFDDSSEQARVVRRQINGQLNRLSEQSRDSIVKALQQIFSQNSFQVCSHILKDCVLTVCSSSTQLMRTLIPHYAGLLAALHFTVDFHIGSFVLEHLVMKLHSIIEADNSKGGHSLISDKTPSNLLLIIVLLYSFRVVHHQLIMDIFLFLVREGKCSDSPSFSGLTEQRVELILCIVENCGYSLRADDPVGLKQGITGVIKLAADEDKSEESGRVKFMLKALSDLKNNKSRRQMGAQAEETQKMRKWLGRIKSSSAGSKMAGDGCLHITLQDFLQAETHGRWWRAGASWGGRTKRSENISEIKTASGVSTVSDGSQSDERKLMKLATKLGMNTDVRKSIFLIVMSSRDVSDAFERLARLDLKGKQDREVVRVICECCGAEKAYNAFYAELASLFCLQNRQYRITLQYSFWDLLKSLREDSTLENSKQLDRRAINMARMLAHLVTQFHLSLSILKVVDASELTPRLLLFLATFFMALFSAKISKDTFTGVLDRVATTSDCLAVREFVLIFLQHHFTKIPDGLDEADTKLMERRRKETIRTMNAMSVLDIAQGVAEQQEE